MSLRNATTAQQKAFVYMPCAIAPISLIGSVLTLIAIYKSKPGTRNTAFHRLLGCVSVFDFIFSFAYMFGPFPVPKGSEDNMLVPIKIDLHFRGTTQTCTAQGALLQVGFASFYYATCLSIYYALTIRYNVREAVFSTRIEPVMHVIILLYTAGTTVAALVKEYFNFQAARCWIIEKPLFCHLTPDVECLRGAGASSFRDNFVGIPILLSNVVCWTCLILLIVTVLNRYRSSRRFVFAGSDNGESPLRRHTRQVVSQSLLFGLNFSLVTLFRNINFLQSKLGNQPSSFTLYMIAQILVPSMGFGNFLVFLRPRYMRFRATGKALGRSWALRQAIFCPTMEDSAIKKAVAKAEERSEAFRERRRSWMISAGILNEDSASEIQGTGNMKQKDSVNGGSLEEEKLDITERVSDDLLEDDDSQKATTNI